MTAKEQVNNHRAFSTMEGQRKLVAYNFTPIYFKRFCDQFCQEFIEYFRPDIYSEDEKKEWAEKFLKEKL